MLSGIVKNFTKNFTSVDVVSNYYSEYVAVSLRECMCYNLDISNIEVNNVSIRSEPNVVVRVNNVLQDSEQCF